MMQPAGAREINLSPIPTIKPAILCVANWDSNVGYAWWLMESFWIEIQKHFSDRYQVLIAYPGISTLPEAIHNSGITCVEFEFEVKDRTDLIAHKEFLRTYNIQHIYFTDRPTNHWSYAYFRCWGIKTIVVHDHTASDRAALTGWIKIAKHLRARLPLINVDVAIGATEYVRRKLIDTNCLPERKCFVAPNGLPELTGNSAPCNLQEQFNIPTGKTIIISTGRATFCKGIDFALQTIARLVHTHQLSNIHYLHCGDGPDLGTFKSMATQLGIDSHVSLPGRVANIDSILAAAHIAFHPSKGEVGYSLSILEYMRSGLPVVIPNRASVCEVIQHQHNGLVYSADNIESAALSLVELINAEALRIRLGEQGKRSIAQKYRLAATHESLINILGQYINHT